MKIAIVSYYFNVGGIEKVMLSLGKQFDKLGHDVSYIETHSKGEWSDYMSNTGLDVITFTLNNFNTKKNHISNIAKVLDNYDFLIINDSPYAVAGLSLIRPEIFSLTVLHLNIQSMLNNAIGNLSQVNCAVGITLSLTHEINLRKNKELTVKHIPNGVEIPVVSDNFNNRNLHLLYLGRIDDKQKGIFRLPYIFEEIFKNNNKVKFTIVGDGPDMQKLKFDFENKQCFKNVRFTGAINPAEVNLELERHGVLIMPSNFEGHPISLLEAMSFGVVPVVSRLKGHTDVIVDESVNGYLCDVENIDSFVESANILIENKNDFCLMSKNAVEKVKQDFSIEKMANKYLEAFNPKINKRSNKIDEKLIHYYSSVPFILIRYIRFFLKFFYKNA